jgi:hypothetical protein
MMSATRKVALLIDCDNVSHNFIEGEELAKYGMVNVRHALGDWNSPSLSGRITKLHANAIRPMQQFAYTKGKNATDSAMIIDAMDLLHGETVEAFALMTSDSVLRLSYYKSLKVVCLYMVLGANKYLNHLLPLALRSSLPRTLVLQKEGRADTPA